MFRSKCNLLSLGFLALSASALSQRSGPRTPAQSPFLTGKDAKAFKIPIYGLDYSRFSVASARARSVFGSEFSSLSPGIGPVFSKSGSSLTPGVTVIQSNSRGDNRAFQVYFGPEYRYGLISPIKITERGPVIRSFSPYLGASINAVYSDITSRSLGISTKSIGIGASAFIGTTVSKNARIELRYLFSRDIEGINLSGLNAQIGIRF